MGDMEASGLQGLGGAKEMGREKMREVFVEGSGIGEGFLVLFVWKQVIFKR